MIFVCSVEAGDPAPRYVHTISSLDDAVNAVSSFEGDALLVASHDDDARPSLTTREVLARDDPASVILGGPVTSRALALRAMTMLPRSSFGMAQRVADVVRSRVHTHVALSSVAGLAQPRPGIGQHLRSFLPRASFDVDLESGIVRTASRITWDTSASKEVCWASSQDQGSLKVTLTGGNPTIVLRPRRASPYGARRWIEVSHVEDLRTLVGATLNGTRIVACSGCGRTIPVSGCPFCGTSNLSVSVLDSSNVTSERIAS